MSTVSKSAQCGTTAGGMLSTSTNCSKTVKVGASRRTFIVTVRVTVCESGTTIFRSTVATDVCRCGVHFANWRNARLTSWAP